MAWILKHSVSHNVLIVASANVKYKNVDTHLFIEKQYSYTNPPKLRLQPVLDTFSPHGV